MVDSENKKKKRLSCPRCRLYLRKIVRNNIEIDVCNRCHGMWLDDKEIDKLINIGGNKYVK